MRRSLTATVCLPCRVSRSVARTGRLTMVPVSRGSVQARQLELGVGQLELAARELRRAADRAALRRGASALLGVAPTLLALALRAPGHEALHHLLHLLELLEERVHLAG